MSDLDALLAAVIDCPEDDTPRLVLADWMDDHGGTVPCPACGGSGYKPPTAADLAPIHERVGPDGHITRYVELRPLNFRPPPKCSHCSGSGVVSDGMRERAEFIRVQVELSRFADLRDGDLSKSKLYAAYQLRVRELIEGRADVWFPVPTGYGFDWSIGTDESPGSPGYVVRRGFVDEVRLSLAAFVGGECGGCDGTGWATVIDPCVECGGSFSENGVTRGTGRVPGLARELFAAHPIVSVRFSDVEFAHPLRGAPVILYDEQHFSSRNGQYRDVIPTAIFAHLAAGRWANTAKSCREYPTRDDAMTALSDACVAYGRAAAGLRPLTAPTPATH